MAKYVEGLVDALGNPMAVYEDKSAATAAVSESAALLTGKKINAPAKPTPMEPNDPTIGESVGAYMRQNNWIGSTLSAAPDKSTDYTSRLKGLYSDKMRSVDNRFDGSWDFDSEMIKNPDLEPYKEKLSTARNGHMFNAMAENIREQTSMENKDKDTIDRTKGFIPNAIGIGVSVLADPTNFVPLVGPATKAIQAGKVVKGVAGAAVKSGLIQAPVGAFQGAVLDATQLTDDPNEFRAKDYAMWAAAGGALFGGVIGANVARKMGKEATAQAAKDFAAAQQAADAAAQAPKLPTTGNAGAARTATTSMADEKLIGGVEKTTQVINKSGASTPNARIAGSASSEVRSLGQEIGNNALYTAKNLDGTATPHSIELIAKQQASVLKGEVATAYNSGFKEFKASYHSIDFDAMSKELALAGKNISPTELAAMKPIFARELFSDLVTVANRNGDKSAIPAVNNVAQQTRKALKTLGDDANNNGLFEKVHAGAERDAKNAILKNSPLRKVVEDLELNPVKGPTYKADLAAAKAALKSAAEQAGKTARAESEALVPRNAESYHPNSYDVAKIVKHQDEFKQIVKDDLVSKGMAPDEAANQAQLLFEKMAYRSDGGNAALASARSFSALKSRTIDIDVNKMGKFLDNDGEHLVNKYIDGMTRMNAFYEKFGGRTPNELFDDVIQSYEKLKVEVKSKGLSAKETAKQIAALEKDQTISTNNLKLLLNTVMGHSDMVEGVTAAASKNDLIGFIKHDLPAYLKPLANMAMLGGITLSSIPDIGRLITIEGVRPVMKGFVANMASTFRHMSNAEADLIGYGTERLLGSRTQALFEIESNILNSKPKPALRAIQNANAKFHNFTGFNYWNSSMKHLAGTIHADKVIRAALDYDNLDKGTIKYLAGAGIDKDMALRIADQFRKHGVDEKSFKMANVSSWDDEVAREFYSRSVYKLVNHTIMTPDAGTVPAYFRGPWASVITQFGSFAWAGGEQMIAAGMQRHTINEVSGLIAMIGLGVMSQVAKDKINGKEDRELDDLIARGIDATGIFGPLGSVVNIPHLVVNAMNGEDIKRSTPASVMKSAIGGPASVMAEAVSGLYNIGIGEGTDADWAKVWHATPGNKIPYVKYLLEERMTHMSETFGD